MLKPTIAVVLQTVNLTGKGAYGPDNVRWLKRQVERFVNCEYRFVALTSVPVYGVDCIRLKFDWPGWYSKLELFSLVEPPAFYVDLDTVLTGDITPLVAHPHIFTTTSFHSPHYPRPCVNTSVMAWNTDLSDIHRKFRDNPESHMSKHVVNHSWVDQGFIQEHRYPDDTFEALFPGQVLSFKSDLKLQDPTPDCRIVMFHGKPKPQDVKRSWIPTGS